MRGGSTTRAEPRMFTPGSRQGWDRVGRVSRGGDPPGELIVRPFDRGLRASPGRSNLTRSAFFLCVVPWLSR